MSDDVRYPTVHVTEVQEQPDGRLFEVPLSSPVCDFCGHDSPAWDYDCHDFLLSPDLASAGGWAACTPCSDMIEADDWLGVLMRCVEAASKFGPRIQNLVRDQAVLMHGGFRSNRYGERRPWG